MDDKLIRSALMEHLRVYEPEAVVHHELPLSRGEGFADCAAVNGSLSGFEIKSDVDSLSRLSKQVADYGKIFDFCSVVLAKRHVDRARQIIPSTWGIIVAHDDEIGVRLKVRRKPRRNKSTSVRALVRLLWKSESLAALRRNGVPMKASEPVRNLWAALEQIDKKVLDAEVRYALKQRASSL